MQRRSGARRSEGAVLSDVEVPLVADTVGLAQGGHAVDARPGRGDRAVVDVGGQDAQTRGIEAGNRLGDRQDGRHGLGPVRGACGPDRDLAPRDGRKAPGGVVGDLREVVPLPEEGRHVRGHRVDEVAALERRLIGRPGEDRAVMPVIGQAQVAQASSHPCLHHG